MKDKVIAKNSFKTGDVERLKKAVTEKIEKLVNSRTKKVG